MADTDTIIESNKNTCRLKSFDKVNAFLQENANGKDEINQNLYVELKKKQSQVDFLNLQEDYIRDSQKNLRTELIHAKAEILRIRSVPLVIGQFLEMIDETHGIAGSTAGSNYYVRVLSTLNKLEHLFSLIFFHLAIFEKSKRTFKTFVFRCFASSFSRSCCRFAS
jgi:hypothetical protein